MVGLLNVLIKIKIRIYAAPAVKGLNEAERHGGRHGDFKLKRNVLSLGLYNHISALQGLWVTMT